MGSALRKNGYRDQVSGKGNSAAKAAPAGRADRQPIQAVPRNQEPEAPEAGYSHVEAENTALDHLASQVSSTLELVELYRSMLDYVPANILLADLDFNIVFMNHSSYTTLKTISHLLPVPIDKIVGGSMDVFHKKPQHQRSIVGSDRNLPHQAKIKLGDHILHLNVFALYNKAGTYMGPMVTWSIITDREKMVSAIGETSSKLSSAAAELTATASELEKTSDQASLDTNSTAASSEEVSRGVQVVATNMEEMSASIKEIARSSADAAAMTNDAKARADEANTTIGQLGESSQEIGNVIKVISSIAQQTNLLALNATIEAARAGDAGRGFAVVANEVKELAKQTSKATEEITTRIGRLQKDAQAAVGSILGISQNIEKLNRISTTIAAAVEEQNATTNEVSRVIQESAKGVNEIAERVKAISAATSQSSTGAKQTTAAAGSLSELAERLRILLQESEQK